MSKEEAKSRRGVCRWCGRLQWLAPIKDSICPACEEDESYQAVMRHNAHVDRRSKIKKVVFLKNEG